MSAAHEVLAALGISAPNRAQVSVKYDYVTEHVTVGVERTYEQATVTIVLNPEVES